MARAVHREVGQHLRHPHHPELPAGTNRTAYVRPQGRSNASCFGNHRKTSENSSPISEVIQNHQQEQRRNPRSIFPRHRIPVQLTGFVVVCSGITAEYVQYIIVVARVRTATPLSMASRTIRGACHASFVRVNDWPWGHPFTSTRPRDLTPLLAGILTEGGYRFCTCELLAGAGSSQVQKRSLATRKSPARRAGNRRRNVRVNCTQTNYQALTKARQDSCFFAPSVRKPGPFECLRTSITGYAGAVPSHHCATNTPSRPRGPWIHWRLAK